MAKSSVIMLHVIDLCFISYDTDISFSELKDQV